MKKQDRSNRKRIANDEIALELGLELKKTKRYTLTKEQLKRFKQLTHHKARKSSELDNTDFDNVKYYWRKEKGLSLFVKNEPKENKLDLNDLKNFISKLKIDIKTEIKPTKSNKTLRIILTDIHVGMQPNENHYSLYNYTWDELELIKRKESVIQSAVDLGMDFEEIHLIDLGDFTDGFNAETTRGGHKLPQNMTNRKQFEVAFNFKTSLLLMLQKQFKCKIINYNAVNCNHSADLDYIVNSAIEYYINSNTSNIRVVNLESFLSHYKHYNHTFVLTHGKDEKNMRFGLKPKLDDKGKTFLEDYCRINNLNGKITIEKGDSHQQLIDECTSKVFDYNNYLAFSPPSGWVQTNFGSSKSGFNLMIINSENDDKMLLTKYF